MAKTNTKDEQTNNAIPDEEFENEGKVESLDEARKGRQKAKADAEKSADDPKQNMLEKWTEDEIVEGLKAYAAYSKEEQELVEKRKLAMQRAQKKVDAKRKEMADLLGILEAQGALD